MKFAYIDESGDASHSDVFVMAGVLIDAYKLRKSTSDFDKKLNDLRGCHRSEPNDFKATWIINGKKGWEEIQFEERKKFIDEIVNLVVKVGKVYAFSMSIKCFDVTVENFKCLPKNQKKHWVACSMFISSLIQKKMQKVSASKGLSVLIFDDNKKFMPKLSDGLYECDGWYDALYASPKKLKGKMVYEVELKKRFDQIINTAFAIKSEHSSLVQVADILSYIYRRHLELSSLNENCDDKKLEDEKKLYKGWVGKLDKKREKIGKLPKNSETIKFYKGICHPKWKM